MAWVSLSLSLCVCVCVSCTTLQRPSSTCIHTYESACIYVCIHICMHICVHIYVHTCVCMYIFAYIYVSIHMCCAEAVWRREVYACVFVHIKNHICMQTVMWVYVCMHAYVYICMCLDVNERSYVQIFEQKVFFQRKCFVSFKLCCSHNKSNQIKRFLCSRTACMYVCIHVNEIKSFSCSKIAWVYGWVYCMGVAICAMQRLVT
jgi:hypothetical protein